MKTLRCYTHAVPSGFAGSLHLYHPAVRKRVNNIHVHNVPFFTSVYITTGQRQPKKFEDSRKMVLTIECSHGCVKSAILKYRRNCNNSYKITILGVQIDINYQIFYETGGVRINRGFVQSD